MDGLILNSRYEGQGMVLMEAKVLGLSLYFPKHLEKYNKGLIGIDDMVDALAAAQKHPKQRLDMLTEYNNEIVKRLDALLSGADKTDTLT